MSLPEERAVAKEEISADKARATTVIKTRCPRQTKKVGSVALKTIRISTATTKSMVACPAARAIGATRVGNSDKTMPLVGTMVASPSEAPTHEVKTLVCSAATHIETLMEWAITQQAPAHSKPSQLLRSMPVTSIHLATQALAVTRMALVPVAQEETMEVEAVPGATITDTSITVGIKEVIKELAAHRLPLKSETSKSRRAQQGTKPTMQVLPNSTYNR